MVLLKYHYYQHSFPHSLSLSLPYLLLRSINIDNLCKMWEKFKSVFLPENKSVLYLITNSVLQVGLSLEKGEVIIKQEYNWTFMWKIISIGLKISLPCNRTLVIQLLKFIAFLKLFQIFGTPPLQLYKLHGFYNNQIIIKHMELRCVFTVAKIFFWYLYFEVKMHDLNVSQVGVALTVLQRKVHIIHHEAKDSFINITSHIA